MPAISYFIGKGGVGKTTISSAFAVWRAARNPKSRVILLSTDPAHSLADVLGQSLRDSALKVDTRGQLFARQIDPAKHVKRFLARNRSHILEIVERGTLFTASDVEPLLDSALPGMAEIAGLLAIDELLDSDEYDEIVVDTAPLGHTLRMFEMPRHFARLVDFLRTASRRDDLLARRFAGRRLPEDPFIAQWRELVERLKVAISGEQSRVFLVTTPEPFAIAESERAKEWLATAETGIEVKSVVLNRVVTSELDCRRCTKQAKLTPSARKLLRRSYPIAEMFHATDIGSPFIGPDSLLGLGRHVFEGKPLKVIPEPPATSSARLQPAEWPKLSSAIAFSLGKGGVGKTTISAALAYTTRQDDGPRVLICSTDPAPSLKDVFAEVVGSEPKAVLHDSHLFAAEVDAVGEYRNWASQVQAKLDEAMSGEVSGLHLDLSFDRELILSLLDITPPGVDEIFAILRITDLLNPNWRMLIDMAPTGHALDLLQTPDRMLGWTRMLLKTLAANRTLRVTRDLGVEVASIQQKVRALANVMRDESRRSVYVVALAEPLPDQETLRLISSLQSLNMAPAAIFVNRVLLSDTDCPRCSRARKWQLATLSRFAKQFAGTTMYVAPEMPAQVAGAASLKRFTRKLWQIV